MKIGILTFFRLANYGANIQALSTYRYLKNHGHDVLFMDWEPDDYYKSKVEKAIKGEKTKHHFDFIDNTLPKSERCYNDEDVCRVIDKERIDAIIIGSDAVLQNHPVLERTYFPTKHIVTVVKPFSATTFPNPFWGSFIDKLSKKIPVAVMSGSSQDSMYFFIRGRERREMANNIKKFSYISVRDTWTQNMIRYLTRGKCVPEVTPDPVFALGVNAKDMIPSKETISAKFGLPDKYVLFSFWNNSIVSFDWLEKSGKLFSDAGMTPVAFPMPGGVKFKHPFSIAIDTPSPVEWYSIIANASAYVGEKMHPIITCLANAVPCFNFDHCGVKYCHGLIRYSNSSKIYHIMDVFGVSDNRVDGSGHFYKPPTPEFVFEKISKFDREKCMQKADAYREKYNQMMENILSTFKTDTHE